jgi:ATP-dependent HslUV protease ATP-binding subunit HslU
VQSLTPRQIVEALDRYIVGQDAAKRAVAIAIRNRWRRQQLPEELRKEVIPKNILMIGPTGVGKTEIARRLAALVNAPFIKVEATKYTEVGYHGRDVESMIRDLLELAIQMVKSEQAEIVRQRAEQLAEERLLDALLPGIDVPEVATAGEDVAEKRRRNRERLRTQLREGELDDRVIELKLEEKPMPAGMLATFGVDQMEPELQNFMERLLPQQSRTRKATVAEGRRLLIANESEKLIDREKVTELAIRRTEESGIIFLDELDKLAGTPSQHGPDVSRQGVQRDLLPIVEGSAVATRYGIVRTDHVLFIAAGAFTASKPSELMPELQGRLPIRVELSDLTEADFVRILTEPENALLRQHEALLATEGVKLKFTRAAVQAMAQLAFRVNQSTENIGARRLYTISEKVLEDISFDAPDRTGKITIDADEVNERLAKLVQDEDLSKYIL